MNRLLVVLASFFALSAGAAEPGARVEGRYVVLFKPGAAGEAVAEAAERSRAAGGTVDLMYAYAVRGFAGNIPEAALEGLRRNPNVAIVEADTYVRKSQDELQSPVPSWGLDRIDRHYLPLNASYEYGRTGDGVSVYVIDTGVRISHTDFGGRAVYGRDYVDGDTVAEDCDGHGTHVAGTVGGTRYGVAKDARLIAVRVLDCDGSGYISWVVGGVDWATGEHKAAAGAKTVGNMSLGGGASVALDLAIRNAVAAGVVFAVAAGNENEDACRSSPARAPDAITVGATTKSDYRAWYSNFGTCVDIFAPGSGITSAWIGSDTAKATIGGTSMATPHVAGVAALYLERAAAGTPALAVRDAIVAVSTKQIVKSAGAGSPRRLLYSKVP